MKNKNHSRRAAAELAMALGLCLSLGFTVALAKYDAACNKICGDTLRLHILANSDTAADQALKLQVRDAVLAELAPALQAAQSKQQAIDAVRAAMPHIQQTAAGALRAAGSSQAVAVRLEQADFAAKQYDNFRLPGGQYTALRIELGAAAGHNWFCVLYPAMCIGGADAEYAQAEENAIVFGDYELRFALLDTARSLLRGKG